MSSSILENDICKVIEKAARKEFSKFPALDGYSCTVALHSPDELAKKPFGVIVSDEIWEALSVAERRMYLVYHPAKEPSVDDKIIMEIDRFAKMNNKRPEILYLGLSQMCSTGLAVGRKDTTYLGLRVFCLQTVADHIAVS